MCICSPGCVCLSGCVCQAKRQTVTSVSAWLSGRLDVSVYLSVSACVCFCICLALSGCLAVSVWLFRSGYVAVCLSDWLPVFVAVCLYLAGWLSDWLPVSVNSHWTYETKHAHTHTHTHTHWEGKKPADTCDVPSLEHVTIYTPSLEVTSVRPIGGDRLSCSSQRVDARNEPASPV